MQTAIAEQDEVHFRPITVAEYYRMGEVGILGPDERVELLDGMLIAVPPIGPAHGYVVMKLNTLLHARLPAGFLVSTQLPLHLDDLSEPEPDFVVMPGPHERYQHTHPTPADAVWVIEVALSSLRYDRREKRDAYARAGVPEYWIVDLAHERLEVFTNPRGGVFRQMSVLERGERRAPVAFPDLVLAVDDLLPRA
jgi:Uma2 family endonuclease